MDKIFGFGAVFVFLFLVFSLWFGYLIISTILVGLFEFKWLILACIAVYFIAKGMWNGPRY